MGKETKMYRYKCCKHHHNIEYKERKQLERKILQAETKQFELELDLLEADKETNVRAGKEKG